MELQLEYERTTTTKRCRLCNHDIEDNTGRLVRLLCKETIYYHHKCLQIMLKKIETLGFLYSC